MSRKLSKPRGGNRGFTILEMLAAIAILLIAMTGPMVFAQQSLRAAKLSRDQVTAFYLAQDAIEFVKHVRDENSLAAPRDEWLAGLEECFSDESVETDGCQVSVPEWSSGDTAAAVSACAVAGDCPLRERDGLFGIFETDGDDSRFSRRVKIMTPEGADPTAETEEALVEVEVTWITSGVGGDKRVLVREHVYNWIQ